MTTAEPLIGAMTFAEELERLLYAHDEWVRFDAALDEYDEPPPSARWRADVSWRHYERLRREFRTRLAIIDDLLAGPGDA